MRRMAKQKRTPTNEQAVFRLDADEKDAFKRYCAGERYPLTVSDLAHRVFRDWLIAEGFLLPEDSQGHDE